MPNYGIATDTTGMVAWEWVDEHMAKARNYWICTTRPDGRPHAAPVWGVWLDGTLYFGSDRQSRKVRNLTANPAVVVHLESGDDTVIFEGTVEEVADRDILVRIAAAYAAKYPPFAPDPDPGPTGINYALRPHTVFAWREQDFPTSATRWRFADR
jgi:nitroimidazol reductase NimA-like FMN-containing flavoprotein (pyridoxamine 5'-phosphate oxidase superfamily)